MRLTLNILLALLILVARANAFSLIGPYADWMQQTNNFRWYTDIGGPMDLGEDYRWNVPVLTYAFDQSFLDYFGSNGVAAVEQAFQILNDLPPASTIVLTNFPLTTTGWSYAAQVQGLHDLKSYVLALLVEQLGLAEPTRSMFVLRQWDPAFISAAYDFQWRDWAIPNFIVERNFDPHTLVPSQFINGELYTGRAVKSGVFHDVIEGPVFGAHTAVADRRLDGGYHTNLTRDDVGGLRYLLGTENVNYEPLLADVHGIGTNASSYVTNAWRPGVEKITFVRQMYDPTLGQAVPITNQFIDTYVTNGSVMHQQLERIIAQPDFLFRATDTGAGKPGPPWAERTATANWVNCASLNGDPTRGGPGIIQPPVTISLHKLGLILSTADPQPAGDVQVSDWRWGSFDGSTNPPVVYPDATLQTNPEFVLRMRLFEQTSTDWTRRELFIWRLPMPIGRTAALQTSADLTNWLTVATVINRGTVMEWFHIRGQQQRFFRVVPE